MGDLLLASQNVGKLNEMRLLVEGLPFRVVGPRDLGLHEAPDETGETFLENATIKALAYARLSGLLTVADDSGLSVDALDGAPGLYSSRFGGEGASDLDRNLLLLEKLRGVPPERRGARFTSAVAVVRGSEVRFQAQESVEGRIAEEMRGENGFGYDPLFFYPPFDRTFGEVARQDKDRVSHRGKAFARLREFLSEAGAGGAGGVRTPLA
jgi:non-canonical purine NTP pyrophosphatase (RdgB/HAM1 family)